MLSGVDLRMARRLSAELGVSRVVGEILARRGFTDGAEAEAFLRPDYLFHDPYLLHGMAAARARIDRALARGERIVVWGDYDADGVTAAFLLSDVLRDLGAEVAWRLPNRFSDGYGLSLAVVEEIAAMGAALLVTVDCGVKDEEAVQRAASLGLDVIVTDHHELGERLPPCIVVSPKLEPYPFPHLAGVGVALKLAHGLIAEPGGPPRQELPLRLRPYCDVAAVGSVADVVPLVDENRALVAMGVGKLRSGPRPGLAALLEVCGAEPDGVRSETIAFRLAPRLNAAGRLADPSLAMELLRALDRGAALPLARQLDELNATRQQLERTILDDALRMLPATPPAAVVLHSPEWHEGVIGIVASRIAEEVGRPAVLICSGADLAKGSGRSVPGFDLAAAVGACAAPLIAFGGHPAACGLRLPRERIPEFADLLTRYAATSLPAAGSRPVRADAVVAGQDLTLDLAAELEALAPHGEGNPRVTLLLAGAALEAPRRTRDKRHLQCRVRCDGACASAVHFNYEGDELPAADERFDVLLELGRNSFNGSENAQVRLRRLFRREPADDLCDTPCDASCPERLSGIEFWRTITAAAEADRVPEREADALEALRARGGLVDARGEPVIPLLFSLLADGQRVLVLVADVGRRRPFLSRDLPPATLGRGGLYLNRACAHRRLSLALAERASAVVASHATAVAMPQLVAAFGQVVFLDPPFSEASLRAVAAACSHRLTFGWGEPEVHFSRRVVANAYDLDAMLRRLWRALPSASNDTAAAVEERVFTAGPFLAKVPVLVAAWRTLCETGLVSETGGKKERDGRSGKVDLSASPSYRLWQQRYQNDRFLSRCLSTTL